MSELPHGWAVAKLGDVTSPTSDSRPGRDGVRFLGLEDVESETTRVLGTTSAARLRSPGKSFEPGDVLYARLRPYLNKVCMPDFAGLASSEFLVFKPRAWLEPKFLMYALNAPGFVRLANSLNQGIGRPRVRWEQIADFDFTLPPLVEQRRIVAAIEEQLSRLEAAQAFVSDAEFRLAKLRRLVVDRAIDGDWDEHPFGDVIVSLRNGVFVSRPAADPPGVPIFRISAVRSMQLNIDDIRYAPVDPATVAAYFVAAGDLLFTRYSGNPNYVGACAAVPHLPRATLHPDKLIRVTLDPKICLPEYVEVVFASRRVRAEIEQRLKTTAGQVGIAGRQLRTVPIPVPPLDEQTRISAGVKASREAIGPLVDSSSRAQRKSDALRRAILASAFRGELVPQDPREEPAVALLERTEAERVATSKPTRKRREKAPS